MLENIFKPEFDVSISLGSILETIAKEFQVKDASKISTIMRLLSLTSSFSMALMFLNKSQKTACKEILDSLHGCDSVRETYIQLKSVYVL